MFSRVFALVILLALSSAGYADEPLVLTEQHCTKAKVIARSLLIDLQQGSTQYQLMDSLNKRPMRDFGTDGRVTKVYLQTNVSALNRNLNKGFRVQQVLDALTKDCNKLIGKPL